MKEKIKHQYTSIGGQALIEGVMMRSDQATAICVRTPDSSIETVMVTQPRIKDKIPPLGWPVIRGSVNLVESMIMGYKSLMISAEMSGLADEEKSETDTTVEKNEDFESESVEKPEKAEEKKENGILLSAVMVISSVLGVALAVLLFTYLPSLIFDGLRYFTGDSILGIKAVVEGIIKMAVFVLYLFAVSFMKDIRRVFMYHGAEHKTIFAYESKLPLTVENVRKMKRFHPRCGTSFMVLMLLLSVVISACVLTLFPALKEIRILWIAVKILLIPINCGLGYELIRLCGRHDNILTRIIAAPGVWVQHLTTKEPDDSMIEVAITSLNAVKPEQAEEIEFTGALIGDDV